MSTVGIRSWLCTRRFNRMPESNVAPGYLEITTTSASPTRPESARRCLFGSANSDENRKFVQKELNELAERDQEKYNFNFTQGKPLHGRFQWEVVSNATTVPAPYKTSKYNQPEPAPVVSVNTNINNNNNEEPKATTSKIATVPANTIIRRPLKICDVAISKAKRNLTFGEDERSKENEESKSNKEEVSPASKEATNSNLSSKLSSNEKSAPQKSEESPPNESINIKKNNSQEKQKLLSDYMSIKRSADTLGKEDTQEPPTPKRARLH